MIHTELVTISQKHIIGQSVKTSNKAEENEDTAKISGLWQNFWAEDIPSSIPNKKPDSPAFGVYTNYESKEDGHFEVVAGVEVENLSTEDKEKVVTINGGDYLVFRNKGRMPDITFEAWKTIWEYFAGKTPYERLYETDFECYPDENTVEVYIGVRSSRSKS